MEHVGVMSVYEVVPSVSLRMLACLYICLRCCLWQGDLGDCVIYNAMCRIEVVTSMVLVLPRLLGLLVLFSIDLA